MHDAAVVALVASVDVLEAFVAVTVALEEGTAYGPEVACLFPF
jgi:hypothetical protein